MRVKESMSTNVIKVDENASLMQVAKLMRQNDIGCIPVCNNQSRVLGFVTDRDIIIKCVANGEDCLNTKASEIMERNVIKTTADTDILSAAKIMEENQIRRLPVLEDNKIVGILSIGDLARNKHISSKEVGTTLESVCEECN